MQPAQDLYAHTAHLDDDEFIARMLRSADQRVIDGVVYPGLPAADIQLTFVGLHGVAALDEAAVFYRAVKATLQRLNAPLGPESRVLDFGVGWGRIIRFFAHDVAPDNLYGVDVGVPILQEAQRCEIPAILRACGTMPPLDLDPGTLDLIYAYSVFSHLNAASMDAWTSEFARLLKPGALAVLTTRNRTFIPFCSDLRRLDLDPTTYAGKLATAFDDEEAYRAYDAGQVVFTHLGSNLDNYGETLLPVAYASTAWNPQMRLVEYFDDLSPGRNQAYIVLRKT